MAQLVRQSLLRLQHGPFCTPILTHRENESFKLLQEPANLLPPVPTPVPDSHDADNPNRKHTVQVIPALIDVYP